MTTSTTVRHPFLAEMDPRHIELLLQGAAEKEFAPGDIIFHEGEPANRFYLIKTGEVRLESNCARNGNVHIETLHGGDVLGWSWLFPPFACTFQARATKPTKVIACDGGHLLVATEEDHTFGHALIKRVASLAIHRLQAVLKQLVAVQPLLSGPWPKSEP
jgi:CRP/FNR family transcriptional regulator, cyclic AMP receptor protein